MQHRQPRSGRCAGERQPQPPEFTLVDGDVGGCRLGHRQQPATRSARPPTFDRDAGVVQRLETRRQDASQARECRPPEVVVAADEDLAPGERGQVREVGPDFIEPSRPRRIATHEHAVVGADALAPRARDARRVVDPLRAESIHGFVDREAEMQIADREERHAPILRRRQRATEAAVVAGVSADSRP